MDYYESENGHIPVKSGMKHLNQGVEMKPPNIQIYLLRIFHFHISFLLYDLKKLYNTLLLSFEQNF